jgi:hypothetical protein
MEHPSEAEWLALTEHTRASNFSGSLRMPPYPLVLTLRLLVGNADQIVGSHTHYDWNPHTTWRTWAFTAQAIAYVEARYEQPSYDYEADRARRAHRNSFDQPVETTLIQAWVRPASALSGVNIHAIDFARPQRPFHELAMEFYPTSISLLFSDGPATKIDLDQPLDDQSKRERWDRFVESARAAVPQ